MTIAQAWPNVGATPNRLKDVFEKIEQSRPLAIRLAGNCTEGQITFSDDLCSTWGFNPQWQFQESAGNNSCLSYYVSKIVALVDGCKHFGELEYSTKEEALGFLTKFPCTKAKWSEYFSALYSCDTTLATCLMDHASRMWPHQAKCTTELLVPTGREESGSMEEHYQRIGWRKGPHSSPDARREITRFWVNMGAFGAGWLIQRIAKESHNDILDGVAGLLVHIGPDSIGPMVRTLGSEPQPSRDQAEILLRAMGCIGTTLDAATNSTSVIELEMVLRKYLGHADPDVREAACSACRMLPPGRATPLLTARRTIESDPGVLDAINDAVERSI